MFQTFDPPAGSAESAARIQSVRLALERAGFDGMLVPRADAHQNEIVAPCDERLAWLTGFTGSAGLGVVAATKAALFVDGRYTLQAADQTDARALTVVATRETAPTDWLAVNLQPGSVLGYDPWLHGREEIERLSKAVERAGASLRPLKANPIDSLWQDRPVAPMGAVRLHPEDISGESASAKRARLAKALSAAGCDSAVLSRPDAIAWLLNLRGSDLAHLPVALGFAILHDSGAVSLFMAPDKLDSAVRDTLGPEVQVAPVESFGAALDGLSGQHVRLDARSCALWIAHRLERAGASLDWGEDPCLLPKSRKNAAEIAGMRATHHRDGVAMVRFLHWLDTQAETNTALDEIAIVERLEAFRRETGCLSDISFDTICGAAEHGAIVHYRVTRATNRTLSPGEVLLVDSGGQYPDGTTDITRTLAYGTPLETARRPFTLVLKGMIAISRARWPEGLSGRDLDALARASLWQAGLDYDHGTGHGVGAALDVHEGPIGLSRRSGATALMPGMILSNEPGYYREGHFGIRIENLLVVGEASVPETGERAMLGFETLTLCPIERRLIDPALLDAHEITWLDAYHARVLEALAPDLPEEARAWAALACAPLMS
ncbi:MAG: aminopeptidase P family protein [Pseudomonadota bacterium]